MTPTRRIGRSAEALREEPGTGLPNLPGSGARIPQEYLQQPFRKVSGDVDGPILSRDFRKSDFQILKSQFRRPHSASEHGFRWVSSKLNPRDFKAPKRVSMAQPSQAIGREGLALGNSEASEDQQATVGQA